MNLEENNRKNTRVNLITFFNSMNLDNISMGLEKIVLDF